jgi:hypothetical protein
MPMKRTSDALAFVALCGLLVSNAYAQSALFDDVHTIAASSVAVPVEHSFNIANPGQYTATLVDLGATLTPAAPLASVKMAVTSGSSVVGTLTAPGPLTFTAAAAGTYIIHAIGMPGTTAGSGPIGITVTDTNNNQVEQYSDTLALPAGVASSNEAVLNDSFIVSVSGSYQVTLTDTQFPSALGTLTLAIVDPTTGGLVANSTLSAPGTTASATVLLQSGVTYQIFAAGQAGGSVNAGLYGVSVNPAAGGAVVYSSSTPVGAVALVGSPQLSAASYTLSVADLQLPTGSTLANVGTEVMLNGQGVAQLVASGNTTFQAAAGTYEVFGLGVPSTSGSGNSSGIGSYALALRSAGGSAVLSVARAVTTPGGTYPSAYSFDSTLVQGGTYTLSLTDFGAPAQFTSLTAAAVQNGAITGFALPSVGSEKIAAAAAGPVSLLVFATPAQSTLASTAPSGLFGISLTANGAASPLFQTSQGVGVALAMSALTITTAGKYLVTVSDVGWPANFANLAVIVTQGASQVGSISSVGTFAFDATAGTYNVNLIAQPGGPDDASTYALTVAGAPPAPTLTLQPSSGSVVSGAPVTVSWSSQNATMCLLTGGGGFSDTTEPVNGTVASTALTSATTLVLSCTGPGGSTSQSVTVNVTPPSSGGGGELAPSVLIALVTSLLVRRRHQSFSLPH